MILLMIFKVSKWAAWISLPINIAIRSTQKYKTQKDRNLRLTRRKNKNEIKHRNKNTAKLNPKTHKKKKN